MKTLISILLLSLFTLNLLHAQTIPSNVIPKIGDVIRTTTVDATGVDEGPSGNGVVWDFSDLQVIDTIPVFVETYVDPATTPQADLFTTANIVSRDVETGDTSYTYYRTEGSQFLFLGSASSGFVIDFREDPRLALPANIGPSDLVTDTYLGIADFIIGTTFFSGNAEFTVDAFGTLQLPSGTYNDVTRMVQIANQVDSTESGFSTSITRLTQTLYQWYVPGVSGPVMSLSYTDGEVEVRPIVGPSIIDTIGLSKSIVINIDPMGGSTSTADLDQGARAIRLSPNPCETGSELFYDASQAQHLQVRLMDANGRQIRYFDWEVQPGQNSRFIDLVDQAAGFYVLSIFDGHKVSSQKIIKH
ncbi:MAG: T9SS type A sorting domain-containing protein [Bacteroidota bacterium]